MNNKLIDILRNGDYVDVVFKHSDRDMPETIKHGVILYTDDVSGNYKVNIDDEVQLVNRRYIHKAQVEAEDLAKLGFKPVCSDIAYGNTATLWVLNKPQQTWTLSPQTGGGWELTLDETVNGESQPLRTKKDIEYIHHVQRCLCNKNLLS